MISNEIIRALAFSAPAMSTLVCLVMMLFDTFQKSKNQHEKRLRIFLSLAYIVAASCWIGLILKETNHLAFVRYQTLFLFALMMDQVLIYRFVHFITSTEQHYRFCRLHFAFPLLLTAASAICAFFIPFEQRFEVIYSTGEGNNWFSALYLTMNIAFIAYNILYPIFGLLRISRHKHKILNYSADMQRTSLNWLSTILILTLITSPIPFAGMLLNIEFFGNVWMAVQGVIPSTFIYPIMYYNLLSDNVIIITHDDDLPEKATDINPKQFSKYMKEKKPYLDPKLRIVDIAAGLNTNRSYVSAFINKEYGMNFSRFINLCRLKELDRLRLLPDNKNCSGVELVQIAGFSNYRSYLRAKSEKDKEEVLKAFESIGEETGKWEFC